jgi:hypothetical protein
LAIQYPPDDAAGHFEASAPNRCTNPLAALTSSVVSTPHRHEHRARVKVLLRQRRVGREDASGLADRAHGGDAALDDFLYRGVAGLAAVAHAGREVGRAEEHAVHAFGLGNRLEVAHCGHSLGLHQQALLVIGLATAICFGAAKPIARFQGQTGINVMTRLMGLILAALSVEVMTAGLIKLFPALVG